MKNLTFKVQMYIYLGILICCFILATYTREGFLYNIGWTIYGLFFILHPAWPKALDYREHSKLKLGCRIAGILIVIIGLTGHFGV